MRDDNCLLNKAAELYSQVLVAVLSKDTSGDKSSLASKSAGAFHALLGIIVLCD